MTRGQIIGSVFENVGDAEHYTSNDIKITGYEDEEAWQDSGVDCDVKITRMDQGGYTCEDEVNLGWVAEYDDGKWTSWWYDLVTDDDVDPENPIQFNYGEGLWLETPTDKLGSETFKLTSSGAVSPDDSIYPLLTRGNVVANPMPVEIDAMDVTITGYEDEEAWQDSGVDCDVKVTLIDQGGYTCEDEVSIGWVAEYDDGEWTAWWYNLVTDDDLAREEVKFPAGLGLWVETPTDKLGKETFHIEFPSPIAKHDAE